MAYKRNKAYKKGDWSLPKWWTDGVCVRVGAEATYENQVAFYNSDFVRNVLGHKGGITTLPKTDDYVMRDLQDPCDWL